MPDLSILCVTKGERCVLPLLGSLSSAARLCKAELVLVADGREAFDAIRDLDGLSELPIRNYKTRGFIESVLDECINLTTGQYVLRLDDDESIPPPFVEWLRAREYKKADHWKFNR